jgi:hypothetical protein
VVWASSDQRYRGLHERLLGFIAHFGSLALDRREDAAPLPRIAEDRISDLTACVLREFFVRYTEEQAKAHGFRRFAFVSLRFGMPTRCGGALVSLPIFRTTLIPRHSSYSRRSIFCGTCRRLTTLTTLTITSPMSVGTSSQPIRSTAFKDFSDNAG